MWWTSAHEGLLDQLTEDQKRCLESEGNLMGTRKLQGMLLIDVRLAMHLFRGFKDRTEVSAKQKEFEALETEDDVSTLSCHGMSSR